MLARIFSFCLWNTIGCELRAGQFVPPHCMKYPNLIPAKQANMRLSDPKADNVPRSAPHITPFLLLTAGSHHPNSLLISKQLPRSPSMLCIGQLIDSGSWDLEDYFAPDSLGLDQFDRFAPALHVFVKSAFDDFLDFHVQFSAFCEADDLLEVGGLLV